MFSSASGSGSPASSSAARRWRSGAASKVKRNAAGAVTITDCPCGTKPWSSGYPGGWYSCFKPAIG